MKKLDTRSTALSSDEVIAVMVCRNEMLRMPYILEYYRTMGVTRFFVVDNDSNDGSIDFLLQQEDVHVYHTTESYRGSRCGLDWSKALLDEHGDRRWCLVVDADEMVIFPGYEHHDFRDLAGYMEQSGAQGLLTFMLDMYSQTPVGNLSYRAPESFLETCPYFDRSTHYAVSVRQFPYVEIRGGARERAFFDPTETESTPPPLKKMPFVRWMRGMNYTSSTHFLEHPIPLADITGLILHFKFFQDAPEVSKVEIDRGQRWNNGAQYRRYAQAMNGDGTFTLWHEGSERFQDSLQMVGIGFQRLTWDYLAYVASLPGKRGVDEHEQWLSRAKEALREWRSTYSTQLSDVLQIWPSVVRSGYPEPPVRG